MLDSAKKNAPEFIKYGREPRSVPGRDPRLDVFRGLALVMIFINHTPENYLESFTSRNFGFSDAAEAFVFLSGVAAGIAYSGSFRRGDTFEGVTRVLRRVWTIYQVYILTTVIAIAIAAVAAHWLGAPEMFRRHGLWTLVLDPLGFLIGVPLLGHQVGYVNILPLYLVLLLLVPPVVSGTLRRAVFVIGLSVLVWLTAGLLQLNFLTYPDKGGWFFNPFSWQLLFVIGVLTGVAYKDGKRLVPIIPWLQWVACAFLLLTLVWVQWPALAIIMQNTMKFIQDSGVPRLITEFNKTYLSTPRLLHILALAYLLSSVGIVRQACSSGIAQPFALLGRHALPVFAFGTLLAYAIQSLKTVTGANESLYTMIVLGGLAAQFSFAAIKDYWSMSLPRRDPTAR